MPGFVASPPPPAPDAPDAVEADGWFPPISLAALREGARVGGQVSEPRLRDAVLGAMQAVMADLAAWRDLQTAASLGEVEDLDARGNARTLGGQPRLVQLWRRAVTAYALADMLESHREVAATVDGRDRADDVGPTAGDHRRNGLFAIRDMIGVPRATVVLL